MLNKVLSWFFKVNALINLQNAEELPPAEICRSRTKMTTEGLKRFVAENYDKLRNLTRTVSK